MDERHATLHVLPTARALPRSWQGEPAPAPRAAPVRVHVVGADPLARVGIRTLLEGRPGIRVTGESTPDPRAVAGLRAHRPHVLVVHGPLPADRARDLARAAGDGVRVLTVGEGAPGPAHGHLPATVTAGQLASAVVLAAAGYTLVHETARPPHSRAAAPESQLSRVSPDQLTERECEVLELLARGLSNGEIARLLSLSEHTVKTHVQNLLHKLRLRNRVHAAIYAFETGLRQLC
ncbi:response regulator transcription factor [Streptomyces sp. NPDC004542]|uniref:response regulator transcription factor n=1 Tax=Streptomyces sp. NPDC004542 TaxID=3154281 RepID=UPI0033A44F1E